MPTGDDWVSPIAPETSRLRFCQRVPRSIANKLNVIIVNDGDELKVIVTAPQKRRAS